MSEKLTKTKIEKLHYNESGPRIQRLWDVQIPGFGVEVFPSGRKSYILRYRFGGKQKFMTLGKHPIVLLEDARDLAINKLKQLASGADPKHHMAKVPTTLKGLYDAYIKTPLFIGYSANFIKNFKYNVTHYILPVLGDYEPAAINTQQVVMLISPIVTRGNSATASIVRGNLSVLLEEAIFHGLCDINMAKAVSPKRLGIKLKRSQRFLSPDEIKQAWDLFAERPVHRCIFRYQLLTGQRISEVLLAERGHVVDEVWTIPESNSKVNLENRLPMTSRLGELIAMSTSLVRNKWLFPSVNRFSTHVTYDSYAPLLGLEVEQANMVKFTSHALRHTFITHCSETLKFSLKDVGLVTGHQRNDGAISGYNHGDFMGLKKEILESYEHYILDIVGE